MKTLKFLGTAASEGIPALFCRCELCMEAKRRGGRDLRTRAGITIGGGLQIDFPPDTYSHMLRYGLDLGKLGHLLITHNHSDHFDVDELANYNTTAAHIDRSAPLKIYFNRSCRDRIFSSGDPFTDRTSMNPVEYIVAEPFFRYETEELYFTPLIAYHDKSQQCLNYFIEVKNGKNVLYALDCKSYPEATLDFLKKQTVDICICDATHLFNPCSVHRDYYDVLDFRGFLRDNGILPQDGKFIASHFSHNGNNGREGGRLRMLHENLERIYGPSGIEVAYDGLELEV